MNYAEITDGVVTNIISIGETQASEFPDYIPVDGRFVAVGDTYVNGKFFHGERRVKTVVERLDDQLNIISEAARATIKSNCEATDQAPQANVGLFIWGAEPWEAGKAYNRFDLFYYMGCIGWVKQAHTSQETWLPFSAGTEALYGARPVPDEDGIYPYVYNMAVDLGMKVRHEGVLYECIQGTESLLYSPDQVPALFTVVG